MTSLRPHNFAGRSLLALFILLTGCANIDAARRSFPTREIESAGETQYKYDEKYFTQRLDHFSYSDTRTFQMRYLQNLESYKKGGPIFFYTGNEGDIVGFAKATGIMWDLASQFNAALIFAEHRFYGKSLPFGNSSYDSASNLSYLSSQQALADYADFLVALKDNQTFSYDTKVIAFGGSYGGMLSAWFRLKYPHMTVGAWASSAPVFYFRGGGVDYGAFDKVTTRTFAKAGCDVDVIRRGWQVLRNISADDDGRMGLNELFKVDKKSLLQKPEDVTGLINYVREAIEYMAMVDYPYETGFLTHLPPWPAKTACARAAPLATPTSTDDGVARALAALAEVYYNYDNSSDYTACFAAGCGDPATASLGSPLGWPWQECSEIVMEMCSRGGDNDFFWDECAPSPLENMRAYCKETFGRLGWLPSFLRENDIPTEYGMTFDGASNLILTQGELDPWSVGGVRPDSPGARKDRGVFVLTISNSAHHLDLRQPNTCDPDNVNFVRYQAVRVLQCWLDASKCPSQLDIVDAALSWVPTGVECKDVVGGFPWGFQDQNANTTAAPPQSTTSSAISSSSSLSLALLMLAAFSLKC